VRYDLFRKRLIAAVVNTPGDATPELRQAVLERAMGARDGVPAELRSYVDTVARHAYKVTDRDVTALQQAGNSEDALFEITVAAAVGAALQRLDRGLAALRGEEPD
jgi:alkylhydroperoxidase family enzyme